MSKLKLYQEMCDELLARKSPLLVERKALLAAATRLSQIDEAVSVIDEELAEYDAAIAALPPPEPKTNATDVEVPND